MNKDSIRVERGSAGRAGKSFHGVLIVAAVASLAACSGEGQPTTGSTAPAPQLTAPPPRLLANAGATSPSTDSSWAAAIQMPAWTQCTVTPQGAGSNDPRIDSIQAAADGEARFSTPPVSWGTKLLLKCSLNGTSSQYLVDLNDSSTFKRESGSDLAPRPNGTLPPLTGDLSTISQDDLFQQRYPPRPPDPIGSQAYTKWVAAVSKPTNKFIAVGVAHLGVYNYGTYDGNVNCGAWNAGIVMGTAGFSGCGTSYPTSNSQLYNKYQFNISEPYYFGCASGTCETSIWGGIGGTNVTGVPPASLIQSGFEVGSGQGAPIQLMWEYWVPGASGSPNCGGANLGALPSGSFNSGDEITVLGAAGTSSACQTLAVNSAPWGCYFWWDETVNPNYMIETPPLQIPTCSGDKPNWIPTTWEFVAEVSSGGYNNAEYSSSYMFQGYSGDYNGNWHFDPGNPNDSGDPYLYEQASAPNGHVLSSSFWANGTGLPSPPIDPFEVYYYQAN